MQPLNGFTTVLALRRRRGCPANGMPADNGLSAERSVVTLNARAHANMSGMWRLRQLRSALLTFTVTFGTVAYGALAGVPAAWAAPDPGATQLDAQAPDWGGCQRWLGD